MPNRLRGKKIYMHKFFYSTEIHNMVYNSYTLVSKMSLSRYLNCCYLLSFQIKWPVVSMLFRQVIRVSGCVSISVTKFFVVKNFTFSRFKQLSSFQQDHF